ncbi:DUF2163 domain-containing protein [Sphingomonas sp. TX0543]|uniref:DUF2163 domain-containing protein n=1 Tax=unclassified Sphingomonas TaxID=196159 RepID=UPI0010F52FEE|nr:DUF2163 domain-containing protein [Sphingomonas sp. 3P27F8]
MDRVTHLAICWRIERRDGVAIGLTDHDRDLEIDGMAYRAAPGMTPSAIVRGDGLDPATMDAKGSLSSAAITERDLIAGRWDGARVAIFAVDRVARGDAVPLGEGTIGAVELGGEAFTAELRGAAAALDRPATEATSPDCRAALGDRRCRVAMAGRRRFARVTAASDEMLTLDRAEPVADAYGGGLLRWFGGANSGFESAVTASSGSTVTLRSLPPFAVEAGALIEVSEGCDKTLATCAGRFGNAVNFRGEPYLPGIDLLTRYPGG